MENLKDFSLFNPGLRSNLKSSQKNRMALNIIDSKIFNYKKIQPQSTISLKIANKQVPENVFFMNENFRTSPTKMLNSLSQSILNIDHMFATEKKILPLIEKFRPKRKISERPPASTPSRASLRTKASSRYFESNEPFELSRSSLRVKTADLANFEKITNFEKNENNANNYNYNPNNYSDSSNFNDWQKRNVYTPYKISIRWRKDFEAKVDGKYDMPFSMMHFPTKK